MSFLSSIFIACLQIRDYHRRNPSARFVSTTDDYEELLKEEPVIEFTGEVLPFSFLLVTLLEIYAPFYYNMSNLNIVTCIHLC